MREPYIITPEWVREEVQFIRECAADDESAHSAEDALHQAVLLAISEDRCPSPKTCAMEALKSRLIDFARWCA